jgi:hypothetical protein
MRGLLKTDRPAPTDAEVAAMLADRREEKYQMTLAYVPTPASDRPAQQGQNFQALLQQLRSGTEAEIKAARADREVVESEPELTPEVVARIRFGDCRTEEVIGRW